MDLLTQTMTREDDRGAGPPSGITRAKPRFKEDLESILELASGDKPVMRCVRSRRMLTAFYGFGDASLAGFGSTMMRALVAFTAGLVCGVRTKKTRAQTTGS